MMTAFLLASHTLVWRRWRLTLVLHSVTGKLVEMILYSKHDYSYFCYVCDHRNFTNRIFILLPRWPPLFIWSSSSGLEIGSVAWDLITPPPHIHIHLFSLPTGWRPWLAGSRRFRLSKRMQRNQQRRRKARLLTRRLLPKLHWSTPALSAG